MARAHGNYDHNGPEESLVCLTTNDPLTCSIGEVMDQCSEKYHYCERCHRQEECAKWYKKNVDKSYVTTSNRKPFEELRREFITLFG